MLMKTVKIVSINLFSNSAKSASDETNCEWMKETERRKEGRKGR